MRQNYLQLEVDETAKKILVINTSKGLKQYQRMPYGIKTACSIFQCLMDNLLKDIPMVGVRTDDILISGKNDQDHLNNLSSVLKIIT